MRAVGTNLGHTAPRKVPIAEGATLGVVVHIDIAILRDPPTETPLDPTLWLQLTHQRQQFPPLQPCRNRRQIARNGRNFRIKD
jgi:hypothetical protein